MVVTIVVIGAFAFNSATREINNIYDAQLIDDANVIWSLLRRPLERAPDRSPRQIDDIDFNMDNQLSFNEDADDYADAHMFRAWVDGRITLLQQHGVFIRRAAAEGGLHHDHLQRRGLARLFATDTEHDHRNGDR